MGYRKFFGVLCLVLAVAADSEDPPVVTTSQGRIVGTRLQFSSIDPALRRSVDAYLGIPYAEAPVGPLRFKPPVAKSWSGEMLATQLGNRCPQPKSPWGNVSLTGTFDEDCLCLDVFVPQPVVKIVSFPFTHVPIILHLAIVACILWGQASFSFEGIKTSWCPT